MSTIRRLVAASAATVFLALSGIVLATPAHAADNPPSPGLLGSYGLLGTGIGARQGLLGTGLLGESLLGGEVGSSSGKGLLGTGIGSREASLGF
ncbi:hypothetical protein [Streptomyces sp. YS-3]|uniref:hypothetical protein n=1 Tax=Streptomyces sp. YS-3 TaxID=3381352 RepID=UPI00386220F3